MSDSKNKQVASDLMAKARSGLILDQPFFASILLAMPISVNNEVTTMATDGESVCYNENWVSTLTQSEVTFVLAHETLHCVFQHMGRRDKREPNRWNQAADYVINQILVDEKVGVMPSVGLLNKALVTKGLGTAEGVYNLLPKDAEKNKAGSKNGSLDQMHDAGSEMGTGKPDAATLSQKNAEMKVRIIQAKNSAKMQGKLSAGLERLCGEALKVKTDWRSVLRRFLTERAKVDFSYARPKRRFLAEDIYLPSLIGEKLGAIVVPIDCSGSINDAILKRFGAEINAIKQDTKPSEVKIIYFDSRVLRIDTFGPEEDIVLKPCGGGGTAFSPVFKAIEKFETPPTACVFLTDLECNDFGPMPEYPVLWATTSRTNAPFGEIVELGDE